TGVDEQPTSPQSDAASASRRKPHRHANPSEFLGAALGAKPGSMKDRNFRNLMRHQLRGLRRSHKLPSTPSPPLRPLQSPLQVQQATKNPGLRRGFSFNHYQSATTNHYCSAATNHYYSTTAQALTESATSL
ncbi:hypothetical protein ABE493_19290, partial [Stenotrophomonas terrae]|uniref:hypothetical protein n=1 Tax=Stenotrophomonas terrae TaxID=405446 RepID=UPI003207FECE